MGWIVYRCGLRRRRLVLAALAACAAAETASSIGNCNVPLPAGAAARPARACQALLSSREAVCTSSEAAAFVRAVSSTLERGVYVYDTPRLRAINAAIWANYSAVSPPNGEHMAEVQLHQLLVRSRFVTRDPERAKLFFVPYYGRIADKNRQELIEATVEALSASPYYAARDGRDHVIVCASGNGLRKHPEMIKYKVLILAVDMAQIHKTPGSSKRVIAVPYSKTTQNDARWRWVPPALGGERVREISVWFEGSRGREWNTIRNEIAPATFAPCPHSSFKVHRPEDEDIRNRKNLTTAFEKANASVDFMLGSLENAARAEFCVTPPGLTPASRRPYDALAYGCVPVFVADRFQVPYASWLRYDEFAVRLTEHCLNSTPAHAAQTIDQLRPELGRMRSAMARVRNFFNYDAPLRPRELGAIDAIMATIVVENKRWNLTDKLPRELPPETRAICGKDRPPPPHTLEDMTL